MTEKIKQTKSDAVVITSSKHPFWKNLHLSSPGASMKVSAESRTFWEPVVDCLFIFELFMVPQPY